MKHSIICINDILSVFFPLFFPSFSFCVFLLFPNFPSFIHLCFLFGERVGFGEGGGHLPWVQQGDLKYYRSAIYLCDIYSNVGFLGLIWYYLLYYIYIVFCSPKIWVNHVDFDPHFLPCGSTTKEYHDQEGDHSCLNHKHMEINTESILIWWLARFWLGLQASNE